MVPKGLYETGHSTELEELCFEAGLQCANHKGVWVLCTEVEPQVGDWYTISPKVRYIATSESSAISWLFGYLWAKSELKKNGH